ncbi:MAG: LytR C-terminal domain-containing protein [Candidatus Delongbacteria bacterium]|jgi:hypothetical protein|nr:LytR C-terminal domain-containing protein [Candidatus Delongbacteria bacterium]MDD4204602.1 LytR C-terminal domain-containing protein [Candidatus Delongbacteria bacterium]MDY0017261.1 LytR C-terminal domain-containing protein [Candidatus Delongbacteria bacterium]
MARIKTKRKDTAEPQTRESSFSYYIIIFLLLIQTMFLFYRNFDFIKDKLAKDPNSIYEQDMQKYINKNDADLENVDPSMIRVSILNGCGEPGLAAQWKAKLRDMKYDVRETGNASNIHNNTTILSRVEDMKYARHLARNLRIKDENVLMQINRDLVDIDVTLIVGSDHKNIGN